MPKIKFVYGKNTFEMKYENTDIIENILKKYIELLSFEEKNLLFLYRGINILKNKIVLNKL